MWDSVGWTRSVKEFTLFFVPTWVTTNKKNPLVTGFIERGITLRKIAPFRVDLTSQGRLLRVSYHAKMTTFKSPSRRAEVTTFSHKSRKRMLDMIATLDSDQLENSPVRPRFITLTYIRNMQNQRVIARDLKVFTQRLVRLAPKSVIVWRVERQERGAWHAHLIWINGIHYDKGQLARDWNDVTGEPLHQNGRPAFTRIESLQNHAHVMRYVAKYVAKVGSDAHGFNSVPYSTARPKNESTMNPYHNVNQGRHWGVVNRMYLPLAPIGRFSVSGDSRTLMDWILALQRRYEDLWYYINPEGGFSLYIDNAAEATQMYERIRTHTIRTGQPLYTTVV